MVVNVGELLFAALDNGDMKESNWILDKHPDSVDARDEEMRVPLHYAADCADLATFQRILSLNRSLLDAQDQFGFTPLLVAVMANNVKVLEYLIEQGAQLGHSDRDGHSAVHWAVVCGQLDVLIALQLCGAPIELADVHGAHPLHYATVSSTAVEEQVPPDRAAAILHSLLRNGVQLECADIDGRTPLLWSASDGNLLAFCSLIQSGANCFSVDRDRLGVLHCAASHGHVEIVREMISLLAENEGLKAVVDAKDRNSDTPLFYAATFGHWECAKLLLENGANVNHTDTRIRTAAHCAAAKGQLRVLKLLRQFGANIYLQNSRGDLPFHEAVQTGIDDVIEWFLHIDSNFVSAPNFCGRTPLHLAASKGSKELAILLCSRGVSVNALMMHKGQLLTPLDVAKRRGHQLISEYLSGCCGALTAAEVPHEDRKHQRKNIEAQIKTAKLRKMHVELMRNEGLARDDQTMPMLRRGHSLCIPKGVSVDHREKMVDASTMVSRRSSSATGSLHFKKKVPRATSTTDLAPANKKAIVKGEKEEAVTAEIERTIQRIVLQELQKVKEIDKERERGNERTGMGRGNSAENGEGDRQSEHTAEREERKREQQQEIVPKQHTAVGTEFHAKHTAREQSQQAEQREETAMAEEEKIGGRVRLNMKMMEENKVWGEGIKRRANVWRKTPRGTAHREGEWQGTERTELHIIEQGLSPVPLLEQSLGRMTEFAEQPANDHHAPSASVARRYVHEKAIFDELTHLKRMQLQYRRVSEDVLVRSLVRNFCRMHSIHPAHFRRVQTFHQWEKFLYDLLSDQLKLIYLEERDRIGAAAAVASQRAAVAAGAVRMHPTTLYSAQQRVFTASAAVNGTLPTTSALIQRRFDARVLPRTDPLEERMNELSRIYGSASSSRNSAMFPATLENDYQQLKRTRNWIRVKETKGLERETNHGREKAQRGVDEAEEGESHL